MLARLVRFLEIGVVVQELAKGNDERLLYPVANAAFATALDYVLCERIQCVIRYESDDMEGYILGQSFYDLAVIEAGGVTLKIPAPLLRKDELTVVLKRHFFTAGGRAVSPGTWSTYQDALHKWAFGADGQTRMAERLWKALAHTAGGRERIVTRR